MTEAVTAEMAALGRRAPELATGAVAASALAMAREIDDPANSATSKSMCTARLHEALDRLRELTPPEAEEDGVDDLTARRAARLAGGPTATP